MAPLHFYITKFTAAAYRNRTSYPCADFSFEAIAEGFLPPTSINIVDNTLREDVLSDESAEAIANLDDLRLIEMVVCSFALHLIEDPSSLFALLWRLSAKARWLVILSPHKKPHVMCLPLMLVFATYFSES